MTRYIAFLPCRKGSQRVPNKNIKPFSGISGGLLQIKLDQLINSKMITDILLSTNDENIIDFVKDFGYEKIIIDQRSDDLSSSETSTDELIEYVGSLMPECTILWTHVTSPFIDAKLYDLAIETYDKVLSQGYDSLLSVREYQSFFWDDKGPLNYDESKEKWPRTQTLKKLYEINSGFFIASRSIYLNFKNRIGQNPYMFKLNHVESLDVDWPEDFRFAEKIWKQQLIF